MAFIGIKVPEGIAQKLHRIEAPGDRLGPSEMHITMINLGRVASLKQVIRAMSVVAFAAQETEPFMVGCALRTCFPRNSDESIPIIARVQSPEIMKLRKKLVEQMETIGIEYNKKYPEFKPHVTLSYSQDPCENLGFGPITWRVGSIAVWGGEEMNDRIVTMVELEG
jgi:2'-5' RNA ligase